MDMLRSAQIAEADLADWRKLAQGLHARYLVDGFGAAARFVAAVGEAGDALGHHPSVTIGRGHVDLELVTDDAVYREDDGTEHVVEWVTQQDIDLARRITEVAADTTPPDGTGWPPPRPFAVKECLSIVLNEEWWHRTYAERDLAILESRPR